MLHLVRRPFGVAALAVVFFAGACTGTGGQSSTPRQSEVVTLSIVGTNDLHGGMLPDDGRGGLALLGGYVDNLRAARERDDGAVLLIDAGDMWQGTMESNLSEGATVVDAYNALGYTAAAVGNHEFDFGPVGPAATPVRDSDDPRGALKARAAEATFPFLAANVLNRETGGQVDWPGVHPSVMVTAAGVQVGIIGVTTRATLSATISANVRDLAIAPLASTIAAEAERLRADGATVVVVAAHAGGACRNFDDPSDASSCGSSGEIVQVARGLAEGLVDVIVAGHTHAGIAHEINGIAVIESGSRGRAFGRVDLEVNPADRRIVIHHIFRARSLCAFTGASGDACVPASRSTDGSPATYEGERVVADAAIERMLAPVVAEVDSLKKGVLGVVLETPLRINGPVESPLGNLFTDAMLDAVPGADVAVNNTGGGLRADLRAGPVTYGGLYEVFPFDNRLVELEVTGAELKRAFGRQLSRSARLIGVAGLRVEARCSGGAVVVSLLRPSGEVPDDERLRVVTTDFLATGALFSPVAPADGFAIDAGAPLVRDLVADSLRQRGGRIRAGDLVDESRPRWPSPDRLPIRCRVH